MDLDQRSEPELLIAILMKQTCFLSHLCLICLSCHDGGSQEFLHVFYESAKLQDSRFNSSSVILEDKDKESSQLERC